MLSIHTLKTVYIICIYLMLSLIGPHVLCKWTFPVWLLQMKLIEDQLRGSVLQKEMVTLQRKLELLEDEKQDHEDRCSKAEVEAKDLRFMGKYTGKSEDNTDKTYYTALYSFLTNGPHRK